MKAQRLVFSIFVALLTTLSGGPQALADDTDIYTLPPKFSTDAAPKVLLVFDTSGSMGSDVVSRPKYDSSVDYITPFLAANTGSSLAAGRIYWDSRSTISPPGDSSNKWVATADMRCQAATDAFALPDNSGYFGKGDSSSLMVQHRRNSNQRWTSLTGSSKRPIDCIQDSDGNDAQTDRLAAGLDEFLDRTYNTFGYTATSTDRYTWGSTGDRYWVRLYTANYIAYYNNSALSTTRARMRVAKEGIQAVIDDNPTINFGLMVYNYNNGSSGPHGGRIVEAIGQPDDILTYQPTTLSANAFGTDTVIEVNDPRSFSMGENIGINQNGGGGIHWTTVSAIVQTTLTAFMDNNSSTMTVSDASGFLVGDTIGIEDNDGIVRWRTISGIAGNTITISTVLNSGWGAEDANETQKVFGRKITLAAALPGNANSSNEIYAKAPRREKIKDTIEILIAAGSTPISESTYEAYRYFAGKSVTYGNPTNTPTPPADLCAQDASCTTATGNYISPLKYECEKAYIIVMTDGAPTSDRDEQPFLTTTNFPAKPAATGTAISALTGSSDGDGLVPLVEWMNKNDVNDNLSQTQTGKFYAITFGDVGGTAQALLDEATQKGTGDNTKTAINATDTTDLKNAFESILADISIETASFGAPTLSVNAFNKLYNRDEVYFALFEPSKKYRWNGNLKKYRLCNATDAAGSGCTIGDVIDVNNADAISLTSKRIKTSALNFWGSAPDGNVVTASGAGQVTTALNPDSQRRLFVWQGVYGSASYPETLTQVGDVSGNTFFDSIDPTASGDPTILGLPAAATTTDVTNLVGWMMGKDSYDEDGDATTTERWSIADPLHGRPISITYGAQLSGGTPDYNQPIIKLVMPGNDGAIRMFNDVSGEEEWAFIPQEMLSYQSNLSSGNDGKHVYGVDNTVTVWVQDFNNNGIIERPDSDGNNDKVYLYASMRRGPGNSQPSNIYAFDISPASTITSKTSLTRITPKLLWVIEGGTGPFTQLGQTWSAPQVDTIRVKSGSGSIEKTALIFGGGYDTSVENTLPYPGVANKVVTKNNPGSIGNAIFMVDAETGARLWWASSGTATDGSGNNSDLQLADMNYPIPSDMALLDTNGDSAIDRLYVGDVGGQVWRIDLDSLINPSGANESQRNGNTAGYVYADLVCDRASSLSGTPATYARICPTPDDPQSWRRTFYAPDIASVTDTVYLNGGEPNRIYDMVFVVSGDRPDPIDRLTAVGLPTPEQPVHNTVFGFKDPDFAYGPVASPPRPITPYGATSEVHDATANLIQVGTTGTGGQQETAFNELRDRKGWMVEFREPSIPAWTTTDDVGVAEGAGRLWIGEKSLAKPVIFGGVVYVTTYTPANPSMTGAACEPNEGLGRVYGLNYLDAKTVIDLNGDGTNDRFIDLGGGIPSELVTIIRADGTTGLVGSSGGAAKVGVKDVGGQERTFWYQE